MNTLKKAISNAESIAITGHVRPDGDCVGSTLGLYNYICDTFEDKKVDVYLEPVRKEFFFLKGCEDIKNTLPEVEADLCYDLLVILDCGDISRIETFAPLYDHAKKTFCIDHHVSNDVRFCDDNIVIPEASSASEILYDLIAQDQISLSTAECIYTGICHDTGQFKHSNTSKKTLMITAELVDMGVNTSFIIDHTLNNRTFIQNKALGYALSEATMILDNKVIYSFISKKWQDLHGVTSSDMGIIIDELRIVEGVEVAIFAYEVNSMEYKISMRAKDFVNVSKIAKYFGGGGHIKAAGCTMRGTYIDVINNLLREIEKQLNPPTGE